MWASKAENLRQKMLNSQYYSLPSNLDRDAEYVYPKFLIPVKQNESIHLIYGRFHIYKWNLIILCPTIVNSRVWVCSKA